MAWTRNPDLSIRDNILDHLVDRFLGLKAGTDGYTVTWNTVTRSELSATDRKMSALAILESRNPKTAEGNGSETRTLNLVIEFSVRGSPGVSPSKTFNAALTDIQRAIASDRRCGGLAIALNEIDDEPDYGSSTDGAVGGFVYASVQYRHRQDDPRKLTSEQ